MKINFYIFLLILLAKSSFAQITFQKEVSLFADQADAKLTLNDSYISTGWFSDSSGKQKICIINLSLNGDTLWTKSYFESEDVIAFSINITSDSGFIITGCTYPTAQEDSKIYLIKTNSRGDLLWTKRYGGVNVDVGREVHQTFDGGFVITGSTSSFGAGSSDIFIIKTDSIGNIEWSRTFGGLNNDVSFSLCLTSDSGYAILGTLNCFSNNDDLILLRLNSQGDTIWTKSFGGVNPELGFNIIQNSNQEFVVVGTTASFGAGSTDIYCLKIDSLGNIVWSKTYGGQQSENGYCISETSDNGYIIGGNTTSFGMLTLSSFIVKINSLGDTLWSKVFTNNPYNNSASINSIFQTSDGGFYAVGPPSVLLKLDAKGTSGCFEQSVITETTNAQTLIFNHIIAVSSPNFSTIPSATFVGGGNNVVTICSTIGINEIENDKSFTISPNPSNGNFSISITDPIKNGFIRISDMYGKITYEEKLLNASTKTVSLIHISSGIYFINIYNGKNSISKKLVIE